MSRSRNRAWPSAALASVLFIFTSCDATTGFEGYVRDTHGRPVEGAKVVLSQGDRILDQRESQADGRYAVFKIHGPVLFSDRVLLSVSKGGFRTYQKEFAGSERHELNVVLEPADSH